MKGRSNLWTKKSVHVLDHEAAELADDFFEGPEKTLVVEFTRPGKHSSLRSIDESTWSALLAKAQCTILSHVETPPKQKQQRQKQRRRDAGSAACQHIHAGYS